MHAGQKGPDSPDFKHQRFDLGTGDQTSRALNSPGTSSDSDRLLGVAFGGLPVASPLVPPPAPSALELQVSQLTLMVQELAKMQAANMQQLHATQAVVVQQAASAAAAAAAALRLPSAAPQVVGEAQHVDAPMTKGEEALAKLSRCRDGVKHKLPAYFWVKMKSEGAKFGKQLRALGRSKVHCEKLRLRLTALHLQRVLKLGKPATSHCCGSFLSAGLLLHCRTVWASPPP